MPDFWEGPFEPVLGTHMVPWRMIGVDADPLELGDGYAIVGSAHADGIEVFVTRMGGLFARIPHGAGRGFLETAVLAFNQVLCEFALAGADSAPVSAHDLARGWVRHRTQST